MIEKVYDRSMHTVGQKQMMPQVVCKISTAVLKAAFNLICSSFVSSQNIRWNVMHLFRNGSCAPIFITVVAVINIQEKFVE